MFLLDYGLIVVYMRGGCLNHEAKLVLCILTFVCIHGYNWPVVYGSYTLEYNCRIPRPQCTHQADGGYTTGGAFDLLARHNTKEFIHLCIPTT